jgi:hypothetical protein
VVALVTAAEPSLQPAQVTAAIDTVVTSPAVLRDLAAALAVDPNALTVGAPPVIGRLVGELIARGSTTFTEPSCSRCARAGYPLTRSADGGVCARCRRRQLAVACARCDVVKPVAGRDAEGGRSAPAAPTGRSAHAGSAGGFAGSPVGPATASPTSATAA